MATLRDHDQPATLAALKTYLEKGYDCGVQAAIAECKRYIASTKMPSYLQPAALDAAKDSVDPLFLAALRNALIGLELPADLNVLELDPESQQYEFSESYISAALEVRRYTLADAEQADFETFREALRLIAAVETGAGRFPAIQVLTDYNLKPTDPDDRIAATLKRNQRPLQTS